MDNEEILCTRCGQAAFDNCYSDAGRREVQLSGLCEKCFDEITRDDEEESRFE